MDVRRAKEIAASPIMAKVTYNGVPIYIDNVNEANNTAFIHPLSEPGNRQEVIVDGLMEH